jgi:ATP-binding cassette subfamily F protein uup
VLAFQGDGRIAHSVGDYDYYLEKKERAAVAAARESAAIVRINKSAALSSHGSGTATTKPRKLKWAEARELEGMEERILETEAEIARIEGLFATPDFHRQYGAQTEGLNADLATAKASLGQLYARWEELEAIKATAAKA